MTTRAWIGLVMVCCLNAAGCPGASPPPKAGPPGVKDSDLGDTHPLNGRIWSVKQQRFITERALGRELQKHHLVLLGEKHDNRWHHQLQAKLLGALVAGKRRPAVAWEMITEAELPALTKHLKGRPRDAEGLGPAIRWRARGWPDWALYRPIARVVLEARLPMVAAGVGRSQLMKALHSGASSQPASSQPAVPLPELPAAAQASLARAVTRSHCGHASKRMIAMMQGAQRLRDVTMARALLAARKRHGSAVLIAGTEHARRDRGAPFYIRALSSSEAVGLVAVKLVEVRQGERDPAAYADATKGLPTPFDYFWFTRRVDNEDPCEKFKHQLQRMRHRHPKGGGKPGG